MRGEGNNNGCGEHNLLQSPTLNMKKLPSFLKKYFWDVDFSTISLDQHRIYILKRLLEFADEKAVSWMRQNFTRDEIKSVFADFRGVSAKSAHFWSVIFDIPKEEILCLKKHLSEEPKTAWPY